MMEKNRYYSKQDLIYRKLNFSENEWEKIIKERLKEKKEINIFSKDNKKMWFCFDEFIKNQIKKIEKLSQIDHLLNLDKRIIKKIIKQNRIEEAIYSGAIEGAFSSKENIEEIIKKGKKKNTLDEKMILNTYNAMIFIQENYNEKMDHNFIWKLHKIITENTLDEKHKSEEYRNEMTYLWNNRGEKIFTPISEKNVKKYMKYYVEFYNDDSGVNPIIKSIILHFYFVYIHPFFDGNGRTARILTYMFLLKKNYKIFEFISISDLINQNKKEYYKQIKNSENLEKDITYFIRYNLEILEKELRKSLDNIETKLNFNLILNFVKEKNIKISDRQKRFLKKIMFWKEKEITIKKYQNVMEVVQETARRDLNDLVSKHILSKKKVGRNYIFVVRKIRKE